MVYDSDFYTSRRPYSSTRPTISSYSVTSPVRSYTSSYTLPTTRISTYYPKVPLRTHSISYGDIPYFGNRRVVASAVPVTRFSNDGFKYRTRDVSPPLPVITSSYRRDFVSPVRVVTSPPRIVTVRVRPSVLSGEYSRIQRRYRPSPVEFDATEEYLNSPYSLNFSDETRKIRTSTQKLLREVHEHVERPKPFYRAQSLQPTYNRFNTEPLFEKLGMSSVDNEFHVSKNIVRPSKKIRDEIEYLSRCRIDPSKRYVGQSHLATTRICGGQSYPIRNSLAHTYEPYNNEKIRNEVKYLSFYEKNRDAAKYDDEAKLLDPARPTRKFSPQQIMEDPKEVLQRLKEEARHLMKVVEEDDIELEKAKQKRIEERRQREEQALLEEKIVAAEKAKKEDASRKLELERQEKLAAEAAAARQAELEKKEEARKAEELLKAEAARKEDELRRKAEEESHKAEEQARLAAEKKKAEEEAKKQEEARKLEEARLAEEQRLKAEEEARLKAEEEARLKAEEEARLAEEKRLAEEEAARLAEEALLAEEARKAEEARLAQEKLAELEQSAKDNEEIELARQASELQELAKQEAEAHEEVIQQIERTRSGAAINEEAVVETVEIEAPVVETEAPVVETEAPVEETPVASEEPKTEEVPAVAEE